jgi:hypothetical protein
MTWLRSAFTARLADQTKPIGYKRIQKQDVLKWAYLFMEEYCTHWRYSGWVAVHPSVTPESTKSRLNLEDKPAPQATASEICCMLAIPTSER